MQADKKKKESMSMWKIILIVNLAVYILSFVIPSGAYQRDGKMAVPGTYEVVEKTYLNPVDVILAVGDDQCHEQLSWPWEIRYIPPSESCS